MRNAQNRGFKHCGNTELSSVLVRGFREFRDIVVRIVDGRRVIIHGSFLVELLRLITCVGDGLGQVAKQLVLVQSALDPRNWVGRVRKEGVDECVGEVGLEVTVLEQQTETVETLEGRSRDQERETTYARNIPFRVLEPCVCVTRMKMCGKCAQTKCARVMCRKICVQQVSVCTHPVAHTVVATT